MWETGLTHQQAPCLQDEEHPFLEQRKKSEGSELTAALAAHQLPCELGHRSRGNPLPLGLKCLPHYKAAPWQHAAIWTI